MKIVHSIFENKFSVLTGLVGGLCKYFLQVNSNYLTSLLSAAIAAFVCGLVGALAKDAYMAFKKYLKERKNKYNEKNNIRQ